MPNERVRNVRVSDELWTAAQTKARQDDLTVAQVIRKALRDYTEGDDGE